MAENINKRERSRTWAGRRAMAAGLLEAIPPMFLLVAGITAGPGSLHPVAEYLHSLPLAKELSSDVFDVGLALTTVNFIVRGFWNMNKSIEVNVTPDEYYESTSKWRRRSLGVANLFVPTDFLKTE
ncbi:MAG TPA: hypothetical protein VF189_05595 [Patescibacteria group bacterium]